MTAFVAILKICSVLVIGDLLSRVIKKRVSGYVIAMFLFILLGGQLGWITTETFQETMFVDVIYTWGVPFGLTCFGASISLQQFRGEAKTVFIALLTVACITGLGILCATTFMDRRTAIYGAVSIAGGAQAGIIFLSKLKEVNGTSLAAMIVIIMNAQIVIGYPVCSFAMKRGMLYQLETGSGSALSELHSSRKPSAWQERKLLLADEFQSYPMTFLILAFCCLIGAFIGQKTGISPLVWDLLIGFAFSQFGLLDGDSLKRVGTDGFVYETMFIVILADLCSINLRGLLEILPGLLLLHGLGILGCALCAVVLYRILKGYSFYDIFAIAMACMVGYPLTLKIVGECLDAVSMKKTVSQEERTALQSFYQQKVVISGIISISVVTGVLAGVVVGIV